MTVFGTDGGRRIGSPEVVGVTEVHPPCRGCEERLVNVRFVRVNHSMPLPNPETSMNSLPHRSSIADLSLQASFRPDETEPFVYLVQAEPLPHSSPGARDRRWSCRK